METVRPCIVHNTLVLQNNILMLLAELWLRLRRIQETKESIIAN